ncbi:hypothetical protein [Saccharopolyspora phatthalungensis]|uniref:Uncharacterized protein n=1 Tax=Saccharopolyspora phatthalungensis TaxID=664693 RepID=A0A840Q9C0_9PSEU|nr:hypothetical protein [Saccharopolyspora phatthalungensis]MBB5155045.1 hypothetical protein [Saccharopolyspora phatthalungensis]
MTLLSEFPVLAGELRQLAAEWRALEISVIEDRPAGESPAVSDRLAEVVTDGTADLQPALLAVHGRPHCEALHTAALALLRMQRRLDDEFRCYHAATALTHAVRGRGPEWIGWARSIRSGVDGCVSSLRSTENIMLRCWREAAGLVERVGNEGNCEGER